MTFTIPIWVITVLLILGGTIGGGIFVYGAASNSEPLGAVGVVIFGLCLILGYALFA